MYANPLKGRMNRQNFIYGQIILIVIITLGAAAVFRDGLNIYTINRLIPVLVLATIPQIVLTVRRLHDMNISGLWSFLILTPYISLLFAVFVSVRSGTEGKNQYGAPDTRNLVDSLLNKQG